MFNSPAHDLGAVGEAKGREDIGHVLLDSTLAQYQLLSDLSIGQAARDQNHYFALTPGQLY